MRKSAVSLVTTAIALGVVAYVWTHSQASTTEVGPPAQNAPPPPQVPVADVVVRDVAPSTEFTGFLTAPRTVDLRARVGGVIDAVSVPEGGIVHKGQLLFTIDPRPFQFALDAAQAQVRQAEALAARAKRDAARADRLVPSGALALRVSDDAASEVQARDAQVQAARAAVASAQLDLSFTRVEAPMAGRVDRVLVTAGNIVAGGSAATLLTTIVSVDPLHVMFDVDEATFLGLAARQPRTSRVNAAARTVRVGLVTDKALPYAGVVDFVGNRVDRTTGTIRLRAVVDNRDGRLTPGLFARVKLATGAPRQVVLVEDQAIAIDQERRYVLLLGDGNKAEYRPVELGPIVDGLRVITSGLRPGDTIITKGLVQPGMEVAPRRVTISPPTPLLDERTSSVGATR